MYQENELKIGYERLKRNIPGTAGILRRQFDSKTALLAVEVN